MFKLLIFNVFIFICCSVNSQDSISAIKFDSLNTNYKDFVVVGNDIYAITNGDSLVTWNIENNIHNILKERMTAIAKTANNCLLVTTKNNKLLSYNKDKIWEEANSFDGIVFKIFVDKANQPIIIHDRGVFYKNTTFQPNLSPIYRGKRKSDSTSLFLREPDVAFLDTKNRIWLTYDNGEFGEETWFFDLNDKSFYEEEYLSINNHLTYKESKVWNKNHNYKLAMKDSFPKKIEIKNDELIFKFPAQIPIYDGVKGIAEDTNGRIYLSQSMNHFGFSGGISIYFETNIQNFYSSKYLKNILDYNVWTNKRNGKEWEVRELEEYLGPVTFNDFDNSIYYYTNKGFFKLIERGDLFNKKLIVNPSLVWKSGLRHSVGSQMAVKKFEFLDEKRFVFLTNQNGIGYYDGNQIKYYK